MIYTCTCLRTTFTILQYKDYKKHIKPNNTRQALGLNINKKSKISQP